MDPPDWADWQARNPRLHGAAHAERPCQDCPLAFALEMRAIDRCNGTPAGVEEDEEVVEVSVDVRRPAVTPEIADELALGPPTLRAELLHVAGVPAAAGEVRLPDCASCLHDPICSIRKDLPRIGLTDAFSAVISCRYFLPDGAIHAENLEVPQRRQRIARTTGGTVETTRESEAGPKQKRVISPAGREAMRQGALRRRERERAVRERQSNGRSE